jgi:hypothetical protein
MGVAPLRGVARQKRRGRVMAWQSPGEKLSPFLYPDIPIIEDDHEFFSIKSFFVDVELLPALYPRLFLDGRELKEKGSINTLEGPADNASFQINVHFDKMREMLSNQENRRRSEPIHFDAASVPADFTFGLLDIVTYPFWFMLTYSINLDEENTGEQLWQINSNLVNHFFPSLRLMGGVLTILHFNEEPIDDAPIHNIVLWNRKDSQSITDYVKMLTSSHVPAHFVCVEQPFMDDRYALHERRPEDGEPFSLMTIVQALTSADA